MAGASPPTPAAGARPPPDSVWARLAAAEAAAAATGPSAAAAAEAAAGFVLRWLHVPGSPFRVRVRSGPSYPPAGMGRRRRRRCRYIRCRTI